MIMADGELESEVMNGGRVAEVGRSYEKRRLLLFVVGLGGAALEWG